MIFALVIQIIFEMNPFTIVTDKVAFVLAAGMILEAIFTTTIVKPWVGLI